MSEPCALPSSIIIVFITKSYRQLCRRGYNFYTIYDPSLSIYALSDIHWYWQVYARQPLDRWIPTFVAWIAVSTMPLRNLLSPGLATRVTETKIYKPLKWKSPRKWTKHWQRTDSCHRLNRHYQRRNKRIRRVPKSADGLRLEWCTCPRLLEIRHSRNESHSAPLEAVAGLCTVIGKLPEAHLPRDLPLSSVGEYCATLVCASFLPDKSEGLRH